MKNCRHKFKPRYSKQIPNQFWEMMLRADSAQNIEYPMEKIYECDVCVKCGKNTNGDSK